MSKKGMMPMPTGSGLLPKLIGGAIAVALVLVVVQHPTDAATWVTALANGGKSVVDGVAAFIHQIVA